MLESLRLKMSERSEDTDGTSRINEIAQRILPILQEYPYPVAFMASCYIVDLMMTHTSKTPGMDEEAKNLLLDMRERLRNLCRGLGTGITRQAPRVDLQ